MRGSTSTREKMSKPDPASYKVDELVRVRHKRAECLGLSAKVSDSV